MGYQEEDGSSISLTDKQIETVKNYIEKNQVKNMDVVDAYNYMQTKTNHLVAEAE